MRWFGRKWARQGARQPWLVVVTTLLLLSGASLAQTTWPAPIKQLLPYVEAEGVPTQYGQFLWVSPTQLLFDTSNPTLQFPDKSRDITVWHDDKNYKIWLFDIETKKTSFHHEGKLLDYEDGILTICLRLTEQKNDWYADVLKGPLGQEMPTTVHKKDYIGTSVKRCPTDPRPYPPENTSHNELRQGRNKSADGCIQSPNYDTYDGDWTYFRNDGKEIKLAVPVQDNFHSAKWIPWLGTYLMGDYLIMSIGRDGGPRNSPTFKLFKPDGSLLILPPNEWGIQNARPTRAGMIFSLWLPRSPKDYTGLYLLRDGQMVQIDEGYISTPGTEVSPDGCKIAYQNQQARTFGILPPLKLRVIDLCKGYHLAPDANPFVWK